MSSPDERRSWRMLNAAIDHDPSIYGPMTEEEKREFEDLVKEIAEARRKDPHVEFSIPTSYDDDW